MLESILQYTLPILVAMLFAYLMVRALLRADVKKKQLELLMAQGDTTLRLRLQAYERMILFLERIHPLQLVTTQFQDGMTVAQLQQRCIAQVAKEYNHNLAQQVYVDRDSWTQLRDAKEATMNFLAESAAQLNPQLDARALVQRVTTQINASDNAFPTQDAIYYIQARAQELLNPRA